MFQALGAAILFAASTPLSKLLLREVQPVPLAALLYLGSGMAALLLILFQSKQRFKRYHSLPLEASISKEDLPWLAGALLAGGVIAPIVLLFSLQVTPASTASLLLNFEVVATAFIAAIIFRESTGRRLWVSMAAITLAAILLSWEGNHWGLSLGAVGVLAACFLWGLDNNFTRVISTKNPISIVAVKGLGASLFSLVLAYLWGNQLPGWDGIIKALSLGSLSHGLSIILFIQAMRGLGAARTSVLFGTAPFIGSIISFAIFQETPGVIFCLSFLIMVGGTYLLFSERHTHTHHHVSQIHDHRHSHDDLHHGHPHQGMDSTKEHAHPHSHGQLAHTHPHTPDTHHRHAHME